MRVGLARLQWFVWLFIRTLTSNDEADGDGAYSCGAVADFHRLPEHPDDF